MAQFDIHRVDGALVLDCQSDALSHLSTRIVAPLMSQEEVPPAAPRLHPLIQIEESAFVLATHLLTAMPVRELGHPITSIEDERYTIIAAIDMLVTGI